MREAGALHNRRGLRSDSNVFLGRRLIQRVAADAQVADASAAAGINVRAAGGIGWLPPRKHVEAMLACSCDKESWVGLQTGQRVATATAARCSRRHARIESGRVGGACRCGGGFGLDEAVLARDDGGALIQREAEEALAAAFAPAE